MASILIASSGGNLPNYLYWGELQKCSSIGAYFRNSPFKYVGHVVLLIAYWRVLELFRGCILFFIALIVTCLLHVSFGHRCHSVVVNSLITTYRGEERRADTKENGRRGEQTARSTDDEETRFEIHF